jgi:hypothetical protein
VIVRERGPLEWIAEIRRCLAEGDCPPDDGEDLGAEYVAELGEIVRRQRALRLPEREPVGTSSYDTRKDLN